MPAVRSGAEDARGFERYRDAERVVCRAGRVGHGIVVRDERHCSTVRSCLDADDVRDVGGEAKLRPSRVRLLDADVESEQAKLVDDVLPGAGVLRCASRPAANGAGEHLHVRARVVEGKEGGGPGTTGRGCGHQDGHQTHASEHAGRVHHP